MVDIVSAAKTAPLRIIVRPNSALHRGEGALTLAATAPVGVFIASVLVAFGAWPVIPFVLLALAGLAAAVYMVYRHRDDFERIVLTDDKLVVDRHRPDGDEHFEFNGFWVQLVQRQAEEGGCAYLALRSHGREVALGGQLNDAERAVVGRVLSSRLALLRH